MKTTFSMCLAMILFVPVGLNAVAQSLPASRPTTRNVNESRRERSRDAVTLLGRIDSTNAADLNRVVMMAQLSLLGDPRLLPCDLRVTSSPTGPTLEGYCLLDQQRRVARDLLVKQGATNLQEHISIGSLDRREGGIVNSESVAVKARPADDSEQLTQWPQDAALFLLREQGDYFFALGPDGYAGWVKQAQVRVVNDQALIDAINPDWKKAPPIQFALDTARTFLGTKYVWGGTSKEGIDCSGLTRAAFARLNINLPRDPISRRWSADWSRRDGSGGL